MRKYSASGSVVWTRDFGTPDYDQANGMSTLNGSEIYLAGTTTGSLAHSNIGGYDAFLHKMDKSGNRIWTR